MHLSVAAPTLTPSRSRHHLQVHVGLAQGGRNASVSASHLHDVSTSFRYPGLMETKSPWLTEDQQRAWRGWLRLSTQLPTALHRQLHADSELSLPDFEVLVHLTESPGGRVRVTELADALQWERSRLSHHVRRMQARGLVAREECEDDGRGAFVVVTERGRSAIAGAAPGHARTVRELFFSDLTDGEVAALESVTAKVLQRLELSTRG